MSADVALIVKVPVVAAPGVAGVTVTVAAASVIELSVTCEVSGQESV